MQFIILGLVVLAAVGVALYAFIDRGQWKSQVDALRGGIERRETEHAAELEGLRGELARLDKIKHVPDIIEKAQRIDAAVAAKLAQAQKEAEEIKGRADARRVEAERQADELIRATHQEIEQFKQRIAKEVEGDTARAKSALKVAEWQANNLLEEAQKKAKEIASQARKEAREKTQKVDATLKAATEYALEIRERAEARAREIAGAAHDALKRHEHYEAAARAMQNVVDGYQNLYMVPASHVLDELAEEYGFREAGERLKLARERTKQMESAGRAATCNFEEGWKRDYAINFVLSAFNGKVDSILSRLKPSNQGKMIQEIKDAFALTNHNGEVFKSARIHEEFLDARLDELKWAVAVQRLKEKEREEQRAIRERIREEEKARKDYERAIKQAEREEEVLSKALERARQEFEVASAGDRARYETRLQELQAKLREAEEKNRRALSMAQQTKCGHVYVISNIGSFGEGVYKIGLTRRLEPRDRVRELGDASVPFAFDVHALIYSEDAPALEAALHRRFVQSQVNKVNRRKEFFRVPLQDIRGVIEEMKCDVKWTLAAEAREYRETLAIERQLQADPDFRKRWTESEAAFQPLLPFDDEEDEAAEVDEGAAFSEST